MYSNITEVETFYTLNDFMDSFLSLDPFLRREAGLGATRSEVKDFPSRSPSLSSHS